MGKSKFQYINGRWINTETNLKIPLGNRIKNSNGDYILLNSDGTATKLFNAKTGQTHSSISSKESNLMRQGMVRDNTTRTWRNETNDDVLNYIDTNYNQIRTRMLSDQDYLKQRYAENIYGIKLNNGKYSMNPNTMDTLINHYGKLLYRSEGKSIAKHSTGKLKLQGLKQANTRTLFITDQNTVLQTGNDIDNRSQLKAQAKRQGLLNGLNLDYDKMNNQELKDLGQGLLEGTKKAADVLGKTMFYGSQIALGLNTSGLLSTAASFAAPMATEYAADNLAGNHQTLLKVLGSDGKIYDIVGIVDKDGNYVGNYIGEKLQNGITISKVLNSSGNELLQSQSIYNNKWARGAANAAAVTLAGGVFNANNYKDIFKSFKNIYSLNPTSFASRLNSLTLNQQGNLYALGQTGKLLGREYLGNLGTFEGFNLGETIAPNNYFIQGVVGTAGGLLAHRLTGPSNFSIRDFRNIKNADTKISNEAKFNIADGTLSTTLNGLKDTGKSLLGGLTYSLAANGGDYISRYDPELGKYITPGLQILSGKLNNKALSLAKEPSQNIFNRFKYITLSLTGGTPSIPKGSFLEFFNPTLDTGYKKAFDFWRYGIDQANTPSSLKENPHTFSRLNALKYIVTGNDKHIDGLTGYFGYSDSPYAFLHKYKQGDITPFGINLGVNKLPEANSDGYYSEPIKVLGGYVIGDKRIFLGMNPQFTNYANTRWANSQVPVIVANPEAAKKTLDLMRTGKLVGTFGDPLKKLSAENRGFENPKVELDPVYKQLLEQQLKYLNSLPEAKTPLERSKRHEAIKKINQQLNGNFMYVEPRTYNTGGIQQFIIEKDGKYHVVDFDNFKHAPDELGKKYKINSEEPQGFFNILFNVAKQKALQTGLHEDTSSIILGTNRKVSLLDYVKMKAKGLSTPEIESQVLNDLKVWEDSNNSKSLDQYILKKTGLGEKINGKWKLKEGGDENGSYSDQFKSLKDQLNQLKKHSSELLDKKELALKYEQYLTSGSTSLFGVKDENLSSVLENAKKAHEEFLKSHPGSLSSEKAKHSKHVLNNIVLDENYSELDIEKVANIIINNSKTMNPKSNTSKNEWNNILHSILNDKPINSSLFDNIKIQLKENFEPFMEDLKHTVKSSSKMQEYNQGLYNKTKRSMLYGEDGKLDELFVGKSGANLRTRFNKKQLDSLIRKTKNHPISKETWDKLSESVKSILENHTNKKGEKVNHLKQGGNIDEIVNKVNTKLKYKNGGSFTQFALKEGAL